MNPSSLALHTNAIRNTVNDMLVYLVKTIIIIVVGKPNTNPGHARQRRQGTTSLALPQQGAIFNHFLQSNSVILFCIFSVILDPLRFLGKFFLFTIASYVCPNDLYRKQVEARNEGIFVAS